MIIQNLMRDSSEDKYGILKLQNIILNIMQHIDEICLKHNIEYYIIGGTALGAIRHGGFIPWDDDLDIAMDRANYNKFLKVCRKELDKDVYYFQEGEVDWPLYFSKVRLRGTYFEEVEEDKSILKENRGIYVDIFPLDNVSNNKIISIWQYFCGKALVSYSLNKRGYKNASIFKKSIMFLTFPLKVKIIRSFFKEQVEKYKNIETDYLGGFYLISRFKNTITLKKIWGVPKRVQFEKTSLLAPSDLNGFLEFYFGDFMILPPKENRKGHHLISVDFGKYK